MIKKEEILLTLQDTNYYIYCRMWGNNCDPFNIESIYSWNSKNSRSKAREYGRNDDNRKEMKRKSNNCVIVLFLRCKKIYMFLVTSV
jgi:hypothetical protein